MSFDTGWVNKPNKAHELEKKLLLRYGPPERGWIPIHYFFGYPSFTKDNGYRRLTGPLSSRVTSRDIFPDQAKVTCAVTYGWAHPLSLIPYIEGGVF